jgi:spore germination cell wall hydrolase CwlJ-like protein
MNGCATRSRRACSSRSSRNAWPRRFISSHAASQKPVRPRSPKWYSIACARNPAYPKTICGVVYQNQKWRNRCQFSFACDGRPERIRSPEAWETAERIAREVTEGKTWLLDVGDSTHYYANYVRPGWARRMIRVDSIGAHRFYRTKRGGWS